MNPSNSCRLPKLTPELMMNESPTPAKKNIATWLVLLAAGGAFALTMGVRQTMGLFLSALNTSTALGVGSISLAFALALSPLGVEISVITGEKVLPIRG